MAAFANIFLQLPGLMIALSLIAIVYIGLGIQSNQARMMREGGTRTPFLTYWPGRIKPLPIGKARIVRSGQALTVLSYGTMVHVAEAVCRETGVDAEIIDLRTLVPLVCSLGEMPRY